MLDIYKTIFSISEGIKMIENIIKPHSTLYPNMVNSDWKWLENLYKMCISNTIKLSKEKITSYINIYDKMSILLKRRSSKNQKISLKIKDNTKTTNYLLEYCDFEIKDDNFFWGDDVKVKIDGYDSIEDCFTSKEYKFKLNNSKKDLLKKYKEKTFANLVFKQNGNKWDVIIINSSRPLTD